MIGSTISDRGSVNAALAVTAPEGSTVTVIKDNKEKKKITPSDGTVIFKGLKSGSWKVSYTKGDEFLEKNIDIIVNYSITMTMFQATLRILYPKGYVCTITDGVETYTAPDTSGEWIFIADHVGIWTATAGELTEVADPQNSGSSFVLRLAWWIIKYGSAQDLWGTPVQLISGRTVTVTQQDYSNLRLSTNSTSQVKGILTENPIDLTDVSEIVSIITIVTAGNSNTTKFNGVGLVLTKSNKYSSVNNAVTGIQYEDIAKDVGQHVLTIDTSEITGEWYIGYAMGTNAVVDVYTLVAE